MSIPWLRRVSTPRDSLYTAGFNLALCSLVGLGVVLSGGTRLWQWMILLVVGAAVPLGRAIVDWKSLQTMNAEKSHER